MMLSPHEIAWLAANVALWAGEDVVTAVAVALAESGGETDQLSRSTTGTNVGQRDHGVWQISGRWHGAKLQKSRWRDPFDNARLARAVFDETVKMGKHGWSAWAVFNSGAYLAHLPDARIAVLAPFEPINPHTTAWRVK